MTKLSLIDAIDAWEAAADELANAKAAEATARSVLLDIASNGVAFDEGTTNLEFPGSPGEKLVVKQPYYYTVDKDAWLTIVPKLPEHLRMDGALVRMKADLSLTAYRKLSPTHIKLMGRCVTAKPGTPSVEIKRKK